MTTVAVLQSNYIPWKGYFDIIQRADLFVFYDDVQFTKNDWRNRNLIQTPQGTQWLTVPVRASFGQKIQDVTIANSHWQLKHWRTIEQNYRNAPFFGRYREAFEDAYLGRQWSLLSELNQYLITFISRDLLHIDTTFISSREFELTGRKSERLLSLLKQLHSTRYISGPSARNYIDVNAYLDAGVTVEFIEYIYPEYQQLYSPFDHFVTILDVLFNCGDEAGSMIWENHTEY